METILLVLHVLVAVALIGLVLLQHGKGADAGAAFGSGASATVFGARGASSFLSRTTAVLATLFFLLSLVLAILAGRRAGPESVVEQAAPPAAEAPAPAPAAAEPAMPADVPPPAPAGEQGTTPAPGPATPPADVPSPG